LPVIVLSHVSLCFFVVNLLLSYLQHFRNAFAHLNKDPFDVTRDGLHRRYVVFRSPGLHQRLKTAIVYNLERSLALSNPPYDFGSVVHGQVGHGAVWNGNIPRLGCRVLAMTVGHFGLGNTFEGLCN
jgi:hypothetical protein